MAEHINQERRELRFFILELCHALGLFYLRLHNLSDDVAVIRKFLD